MKNYLSVFILFSALLVVSSCKDSAKSETPEVQTEAPAAAPAPEASSTPVPVPAPQTAEPAQNAKGVWHYTCPKGCEGGAGAQGNCAKCGTALAHNAAYHQQ